MKHQNETWQKTIISTSDVESGAFSHGDLGRRLPIRSQLVEVTLTLSGELSKSLDSVVGDATPFVGEDKLPDVMGLQLLNVQVPSLEQNAATGHIPREPLDWRVQSQTTTLTSWHVRPDILRETSRRGIGTSNNAQ